ncbi:radical SAM family heme chaperone HemW [Prevotella sp. lc2012]|uniref:radical SAM family heme chaperone HemW n=1 Tax=Prevotella sp. lc2012 TaxID=1761886 RepID=UPI00089B1262|nr:radical SAM family heme chaperone HemW [Prevotella sp. lc2012]SEE60889.1 oxygen-independent coproporphyrinogen-3 oxidase [Prevotella sp. lc2012]
MAGIYIHIPFCKTRCIYCGFYSSTRLEWRQSYIDAVCKEMELRHKELTADDGNTNISTIYLGGGTPSLLTPSQIEQLFHTVYRFFSVADNAEVTMECNPDDVTEDFAKELCLLPVNRVSMGAQTFNNQRLKLLRRRHSAHQVTSATERLRTAGICNISIDLMYGFPGETQEEWDEDIRQALALQPEHLSAYCLMIEEGTPLYQMQTEQADEKTERKMYETLIDRLEEAGYEHYEISNFARPGYRSRHNSSYWTGIPYLGFGAAAHSYDIKSRSWNISDINLYIEGLRNGQRIFEEEILNKDTRYNDMVTVALRTREGLDLTQLSEEQASYCRKNATPYIKRGWLEEHKGRIRLTREGLFVSDLIMSELMVVD